MHCPDCGGGDEDQGAAPDRGVVCMYPPGVTPTAGDWQAVNEFRSVLADRRRRPGHLGQRGRLQPSLAGYLRDRLPPEGVTYAVALWNKHMRSIPFTNPHATAMGILNGTLRWSNIPTLPPLSEGALAPVRAEGAEVWRKRSWLHLDALAPFAEGFDLTGWDVNAMYCSAAGTLALGTGEPVLTEWPAAGVWKLPGFVQVSTLEGAPWSIARHWTEGMWMPSPWVDYLDDYGAQFLTPAALVWPEHRRWLRPHVDLFRDARRGLMTDDSDAAAELVELVKDIEHRIFGGLLASERNKTPTMRRDWLAQVTATGQTRMFRNLDAIQGPGVKVIGVFADCAWVLLPKGFKVPPGLNVDPTGIQFGAFKPAGRVAWTPELHAAWQDDRQRVLWEALDASKDAEATDVRS